MVPLGTVILSNIVVYCIVLHITENYSSQGNRKILIIKPIKPTVIRKLHALSILSSTMRKKILINEA